MQLKLTTWNINSVRLRINLVAKFIKSVRPDVLCLQEIKCLDDAFPLKRFKRLGYEHIALNGQKGYHGVAVISRLPFDSKTVKGYCGKTDSRHVGAVLGEKAGLRDPLTIHNYYVPAGGDEPDPEINPKFAHKLAFLDELRACPHMLPGARAALHRGRRSQRRAARMRRLEPQGAAQGRVAHADRMREARRRAEGRQLDRRRAHLRARAGEALHLVELSLARLGSSPTRAAASTTSGFRRALGDRLAAIKVTKDARGWERPSDHVPVTVTLDV